MEDNLTLTGCLKGEMMVYSILVAIWAGKPSSREGLKMHLVLGMRLAPAVIFIFHFRKAFTNFFWLAVIVRSHSHPYSKTPDVACCAMLFVAGQVRFASLVCLLDRSI